MLSQGLIGVKELLLFIGILFRFVFCLRKGGISVSGFGLVLLRG